MKYFYDCEFIEDGKTIDLISIGMLSEDGREYYAQNQECLFYRASDWVKQNVFPFLAAFPEPHTYAPSFASPVDRLKTCWRSRAEITRELQAFCDPEKYGKPEFWGYYADYDHVALCQLFGTMMNLPKGWPMYTRDLKQWCVDIGDPTLIVESAEGKEAHHEHHALSDARWNKQVWEFLNNLSLSSAPVGLLIFCPHCGEQHIDRPQPEKGWINPPHRSHECQSCNWVWRHADIYTNGVAEIKTKGQRDQDPNPVKVIPWRFGPSEE